MWPRDQLRFSPVSLPVGVFKISAIIRRSADWSQPPHPTRSRPHQRLEICTKMFIPYLLLSFLFMKSAVCARNERQIVFKKKPGILHLSPHSEPNATCSETSCSLLRCANACAVSSQCILFSHSKAEGACVISDKPETDEGSYGTPDASWDTYEIECLLNKGYAVYTTAQSNLKLCLKFVSTPSNQTAADDHCKADGARLVRAKTWEIWDVVNDLSAEYSGFVWMGADDKALQGDYRWNDGTPLNETLWSTGEPNHSHERCVMAMVGGLGDQGCEATNPFICQFKDD